ACQCHFFGDCGTHAARCAGNKDRFAFDFHESSPRVISVAAKWLMSALGHKRTWKPVRLMSALLPKADIDWCSIQCRTRRPVGADKWRERLFRMAFARALLADVHPHFTR